MYIPGWLVLIAGVIVTFLIYHSRKRINDGKSNERIFNIKEIEANVRFQKKGIFSLEHFDSPHFIDLQNAFDAMEINYLRLKQRLFHDKTKVREIAYDWENYVLSLGQLKQERVALDSASSEDDHAKIDDRMKEPFVIKEEVEKKFKSMLGEDWREIPPNYFEKIDTMEKPDKKTIKEYKPGDDWKYYYRDSVNLLLLEEKRKNDKK